MNRNIHYNDCILNPTYQSFGWLALFPEMALSSSKLVNTSPGPFLSELAYLLFTDQVILFPTPISNVISLISYGSLYREDLGKFPSPAYYSVDIIRIWLKFAKIWPTVWPFLTENLTIVDYFWQKIWPTS